ncbi:hypothetical protein JFV29_12450 [Peribacillus sp. TH16]|uniref:GTP pyrophosphokinase n=1 Tax=Peribacillus sp. TH16 TaxID=2798482 RepID=UPI0019126E83|nr:hypothetical protein [Peribacillus sp. TH16]MBK5482693.1 hypothetical protein [Peribacillus sp. TH16]
MDFTTDYLDYLKPYKTNVPFYNSLIDEALFILDKEIKALDIKTQPISFRVKDEVSFINKVKRKEIKEPFKEITDFVGLRVVCLFRSDIKRIETIIKDNFLLIEEDNKIDGNQTEFGYMSYHYIVKLKEEYSGPRYDEIKGISFEIQVRTISMDAWANISHYLDYKTVNDVPASLRKDFNAISGLFYVADTHFEVFFQETLKNKEETEEKIEHLLEDTDNKEIEEINFDSLRVYLNKKFPERVHSQDKTISDIVNELLSFDYKTINQLDEVVNKTLNAALKYEAEFPPVGEIFEDGGIMRAIIGIYENKSRKSNKGIYNLYEQYIEK